MKVVFALGDSLTYGAWDREGYGWTSLLRAELDDREPYPGYYFYSLGIPGETSQGLQKRFISEIDARKRYDDHSYFFVLECGANDATWLNGERRFKTTSVEYEENMKSIIKELKNRTDNILLMNITPVNEKFSTQFMGKDKTCLNKYVDEYNKVLREVCDEEDVRLIDINAIFEAQGSENLLSEDGLHPNSRGHLLIFETIKRYVH